MKSLYRAVDDLHGCFKICPAQPILKKEKQPHATFFFSDFKLSKPEVPWLTVSSLMHRTHDSDSDVSDSAIDRDLSKVLHLDRMAMIQINLVKHSQIFL